MNKYIFSLWRMVVMLTIAVGGLMCVNGQKVVKCKVNDTLAPKYKIGLVNFSVSGPQTLLLQISVAPKDFNREAMMALARRLNEEFCNEQRINVALFDDQREAKSPALVYAYLTHQGQTGALRGFYDLDRTIGKELLLFSTQRNKPLDEVKLEVPARLQSVKGISKETAIAIAKKDALKTYKLLDDFNIIACEQQIFWRIIFDKGGPEYVIDKTSGAIRRVQQIPQESAESASHKGKRQAQAEINEQEAIDIAKRDASKSARREDMEKFTVYACELEKVWRVFVEVKLYIEPGRETPIIPHASTPNYVVDKKTGKIIFKQRFGDPTPQLTSAGSYAGAQPK